MIYQVSLALETRNNSRTISEQLRARLGCRRPKKQERASNNAIKRHRKPPAAIGGHYSAHQLTPLQDQI
jgi:hypothetical protein